MNWNEMAEKAGSAFEDAASQINRPIQLQIANNKISEYQIKKIGR